jgi:hypothetical protein
MEVGGGASAAGSLLFLPQLTVSSTHINAAQELARIFLFFTRPLDAVNPHAGVTRMAEKTLAGKMS